MTDCKEIKSFCLFGIFAITISYLSIYNLLFLIVTYLAIPMLISRIYYQNGFISSLYVGIAIIVFNNICCYICNHPYINSAAFIFTLYCLVYGYILGFCFKKHYSYQNILKTTCAFDFILILLVFAVLKYYAKVDITLLIRRISSDSFYDFVEWIDIIKPDIDLSFLDDKTSILEFFYIFIPGIIPAITIIFSLISSTIRFFVCKSFIRQYLIKDENFSDGFDKFRVSSVTNIVFILCIIINLSDNTNVLTITCMNMIFVISVLYSINTISIIEYNLKKRSVSVLYRVGMTILYFIIAAVVTGIIPIITIPDLLIITGFSDGIFDYRKLNCKKDELNEK